MPLVPFKSVDLAGETGRRPRSRWRQICVVLSLSLSLYLYLFFFPNVFYNIPRFSVCRSAATFFYSRFFSVSFFLCRARPRLPKKNIERPCSSSSSSSRSCDHKELFCASHFTRETERENERNVDLSMPSTFYLPSCTEFFFPQRPFRHFRFLVLFFFTIFFLNVALEKENVAVFYQIRFSFFLFK